MYTTLHVSYVQHGDAAHSDHDQCEAKHNFSFRKLFAKQQDSAVAKAISLVPVTKSRYVKFIS